MAYLEWIPELDTGIVEVDRQHRRIVSYINELHDARIDGSRKGVSAVLDETIDYTLSHFAFEEQLMIDAGYMFSGPHKKVHELFARRVSDFKARFDAGEDVGEELHSMLSRWLFNHIRNDDKGFIEAVHMFQKARGAARPRATPEMRRGWFSRLVDRLTGTTPDGH